MTATQPINGHALRAFPTGATRSTDTEGDRYDLITPFGLQRLARRYGDGAKTHGERNWEQGVPASTTVNHMVRHLFLWLWGDRSDDHLAAVAWGAFALMHYEATAPEMIDTPKQEP